MKDKQNSTKDQPVRCAERQVASIIIRQENLDTEQKKVQTSFQGR